MADNQELENQETEGQEDENQGEISVIVNPSAGAPGWATDPTVGGVFTGYVTSLGDADDGSLIDEATFTPKSPNPLKRLWIGRCTIYEYQTITNQTTHQSVQSLVPVLENEPCRLSYRFEQATNIQSGRAVVSQSITLFIRPDLEIKPGSVIDITQHGRTTRFKGAGKPAVYTNHQELIMELDEEHA